MSTKAHKITVNLHKPSLPPLNMTSLSPNKTAPTSPNRLSPTHEPKSNSSRSPNKTPQKLQLPVPPRSSAEGDEKDESEGPFENKNNNYNSGLKEDYNQSRNQKEQSHKNPLKNLQNLIDDMKSTKSQRSNSATKIDMQEASKTPQKWPSVVSTTFKKSENGAKVRKRPLSSNERFNEFPEDDEIQIHAKSANKNLQLEIGIEDKDGLEGRDGLFGEELSERETLSCKNSRDVGPIRYSKMSEEDAATVFEMRRRELLNFLAKLGANHSLVKKKFSYLKPGCPKRGNISGQNSEMKSDWDFGNLRAVRETMKESSSPTRFIVYNVATTDQNWTNNTRLARISTPNKTGGQRRFNSLKPIKSADSKRRNSCRVTKDRDDSSVQRNLETSFNQVQDWPDVSEFRVSRRNKHYTDTTAKSVDDKRDPLESIKIDLKKVVKRNKKQHATNKSLEKIAMIEKLDAKHTIFDGPAELAREINETQKETEKEAPKEVSREIVKEKVKENTVESFANKQIIDNMRKKTKLVMSDIEEIDILIQQMEADHDLKKAKRKGLEQAKQNVSQGREMYSRKADDLKKELSESETQEGYAYAAYAKKGGKERPRSMGFKNTVIENTKSNEPPTKELNNNIAKKPENLSPSKTPIKNKAEAPKIQKFDLSREKSFKKSKQPDRSEAIENKARSPRSGMRTNEREYIDNTEEDTYEKRGHMNKLPTKKEVSKPAGPDSNLALKSVSHSAKTESSNNNDIRRNVVTEQNVQTENPREIRNERTHVHSQSAYLKPTIKQNETPKYQPQIRTENKKDVKKAYTPSAANSKSKNVYGQFPTSQREELFESSDKNANQAPSALSTRAQAPSLVKAKSQPEPKNQPKKQTTSKSMYKPPVFDDYLPSKSDQDELFDRNSQSDTQNPYQQDAYHQEMNKHSSKNSFFDEVKKILKEGATNADRRTPTSLTDKSKKSTNSTAKSSKNDLNKSSKKEPLPNNRPRFDTAPSPDFKTKVAKDIRLFDEISKSLKQTFAGVTTNKGVGRAIKLLTLEDAPKTASRKNPSTKVQKGWDIERRKSETGQENGNNDDGSILFEPSTERLNRNNYQGRGNSINYVENNNMRKDPELGGQSVKNNKKFSNTPGTEYSKKDINSLKRKKMAAYPIS